MHMSVQLHGMSVKLRWSDAANALERAFVNRGSLSNQPTGPRWTGKVTTVNEMTVMLERAGIFLTPEEMEKWTPSYEFYVDGLAKLRSIKLDGVEAATVFRASWGAEA